MDLRYTTVKRLRDEGWAKKNLPFDKAVRCIKDASQILTDILGQWFNPVRQKVRLDGHGASIVYFPNRIPILEILSLSEGITSGESGQGYDFAERAKALAEGLTSYSSDDFIVKARSVEVKYSNFFAGRANVLLEGYTGWLEEFDRGSRDQDKRKIVTTTNGDIVDQAVSGTLVSVDNIKERDILLFESNDSLRQLLAFAIANKVVRGSKKVEFDRIETENDTAIPSGSRVVVFGSVPRLIELATIILVKRVSVQINSEEYDNAVLDSKLRGEKTDRYSYTLYGSKDGGGVGITGDPLVDKQLANYFEPAYVDIV